MVSKTCKHCDIKFNTHSVRQVMCDRCRCLMSQLVLEDKVVLVKLKDDYMLYKVAKISGDFVTLQKSTQITTEVHIDDIMDFRVGCAGCSTVQEHTRPNSEPNVLSPCERKTLFGHKYCFECGRELTYGK